MSLTDIQARDPVAAFAIARTIKLEGGFVDDAADPGGATNRGVSLRFALQEAAVDPDLARLLDVDHNGDVDRADIRGLTLDTAAEVYMAAIWTPGWYRRLTPGLVAWKCFDIAVNAGPKRAAITLQKSLAILGAEIRVDASVGLATIAAAEARTAPDGGFALLAEMRTVQADFYRRLAVQEPKLDRFLKGWLNRAAA